MRVQSLSRKVPLEEGMAKCSNILAWKVPWAENLVGYSTQCHNESDIIEVTWREFTSLILGNNNEPFLGWTVMCDKKWILYDSQ